MTGSGWAGKLGASQSPIMTPGQQLLRLVLMITMVTFLPA
jgi:hypothetical protein